MAIWTTRCGSAWMTVSASSRSATATIATATWSAAVMDITSSLRLGKFAAALGDSAIAEQDLGTAQDLS
ncbi:hypothetical protein ACQPXH_25765 [Nocardia sp. CA-135953]|uniref:hypothetical protein n=1 Tax=Nocardia sp. CA-135953 TaxID=3239978 RepID=UPI003D96F7F9